MKVNEQIHRMVIDIAANPVLLSVWQSLVPRVERARSLSNLDRARWTAALFEHSKMFAALAARDAPAAPAAGERTFPQRPAHHPHPPCGAERGQRRTLVERPPPIRRTARAARNASSDTQDQLVHTARLTFAVLHTRVAPEFASAKEAAGWPGRQCEHHGHRPVSHPQILRAAAGGGCRRRNGRHGLFQYRAGLAGNPAAVARNEVLGPGGDAALRARQQADVETRHHRRTSSRRIASGSTSMATLVAG